MVRRRSLIIGAVTAGAVEAELWPGPPVFSQDRRERTLAIVCALLGLFSVGALLAWVFGLGKFGGWFWFFSFPSLLLLVGVAVWLLRSGRYPRLRTAMAAGAFGGLIGTFGYDIFRIPFYLVGLRLMSPIDSYGVLILGTDSSSAWTGLAGWSYHFSNGIGFGVAYGIAALGRRWWWGIVWGLVLETATVLTPFASTYRIKGEWGLIALAYLAHVAYGFPLGRIVQSAGSSALRDESLIPVSLCIAGLAVGLLIWHRPWSVSQEVRDGQRVAPGASAVISYGRFEPLWLRIAPGGCATVRNIDSEPRALTGAGEAVTIKAEGEFRLCLDEVGIHRIKVDDESFSGGFVVVDPES